MLHALHSELLAFPGLASSHAACSDRHAQCTEWSAAGECARNQGFMLKQCARSCDSCGWDVGLGAPSAIRASIQDESGLMMPKEQGGSCSTPIKPLLRWGVDHATAESICCFNREGAEPTGSWTTSSLEQVCGASKCMSREFLL